MHFWYLHFRLISILVDSFLEHLCSSMKIENYYYFGPYHLLSNENVLRDTQSALLTH